MTRHLRELRDSLYAYGMAVTFERRDRRKLRRVPWGSKDLAAAEREYRLRQNITDGAARRLSAAILRWLARKQRKRIG